MDEKHIAQLEARIEKLIEGVFSNIFRQTVNAHDIAREIARSVDDTLRYNTGDDPRPIAADQYTIHLHPDVHSRLQSQRPQLAKMLTDYIVDLVSQAAYRLLDEPDVVLLADPTGDKASIRVTAIHTQQGNPSTQSLLPIKTDDVQPVASAQLIIGDRAIPLTEPLLNIGRGADNHIILDDAYVSRHHVQLRKRFGLYTLFDVNSRGGTFVNDVRVMEHRLQSGDVILIGNTKLIYMAEGGASNQSPGTTQTFSPVDI